MPLSSSTFDDLTEFLKYRTVVCEDYDNLDWSDQERLIYFTESLLKQRDSLEWKNIHKVVIYSIGINLVDSVDEITDAGDLVYRNANLGTLLIRSTH